MENKTDFKPYIPADKVMPEFSVTAAGPVAYTHLTDASETVRDGTASADTSVTSTQSDTSYSDGKVNINTAGLEELMTLKGVGESRARAIIEYREQQGAFETPDDIMNISGIKEGVFSKIKDQIAVR